MTFPAAFTLALALSAAVASATGTSASLSPPAIGQTPSRAITVFAASDLGPPFKQIIPEFERATGTRVTLVLGSTGTLAQQIRNGAPADVFFAANEAYVEQLSAESLTSPGTRALYARGRIVLVTRRDANLRVLELGALAHSGVRRVAIANPQHAPYGLAAKQALEKIGLWKAVEHKLVYGENVQQAVQFVRSGSAEAGVVARSVADADDLRWTLVDESLHAPLNQAAVVIARTTDLAASRDFIAFVNSAQGRAVMRQFGFLSPRD